MVNPSRAKKLKFIHLPRVIALPTYLSIGSGGCGALAIGVDTVVGYCEACSFQFLFLLAIILEDTGHVILTFLVLGMIGVEVGQGLQGIDETEFWSL